MEKEEIGKEIVMIARHPNHSTSRFPFYKEV